MPVCARHRWLLVLVVLLCAVAVACGGRRGRRGGGGGGDDAGPSADGGGGIDAGPGMDGAVPDASPPRDAGPDTGPVEHDAGWDGGRDAGPEETDAGPTGDTIDDIQRGVITEGTTVTVRDVVVTGIWSEGAYVQDPAGGTTYAGVRVYTVGSPGVAVGDRVDVTGQILEYFGETEIESATITYRGAATPITPLALTVAQALTEPYEGMLVRLTDISSATTSHDCSTDHPSCSDTNLWLVQSGASSIVVDDRLYEDSDWLTHAGSTDVTGVMGWRFDRRRIRPRTAADF